MNELIERLAREAGIFGDHVEPRYLEAFAKAVARECSEIADEVSTRSHDMQRISAARECAETIRERFGL